MLKFADLVKELQCGSEEYGMSGLSPSSFAIPCSIFDIQALIIVPATL
jgi:hypothetical protein